MLVDNAKLNANNTFLSTVFITAAFETGDEGFQTGIADCAVLIRKLQAANRELAQQNAAKNLLFSIISHDLRSLFCSLLGHARLLSEGVAHFDTDDIQEMTRGIYQSANSIYNLTDDLLTWSGLHSNHLPYEPDSLELYELVKSLVTVFQPMAETKGIRLNYAVEPGLFVLADAEMVRTIIRNLISNALKFTPEKGQVTISARPEGTEWAEIEVADTGVGISLEHQAKLFDIALKYSTPGTAGERGTGLGLIICAQMVTKHGGKIWIDSQPGVGTQIKFTVPIPATESADT